MRFVLSFLSGHYGHSILELEMQVMIFECFKYCELAMQMLYMVAVQPLLYPPSSTSWPQLASPVVLWSVRSISFPCLLLVGMCWFCFMSCFFLLAMFLCASFNLCYFFLFVRESLLLLHSPILSLGPNCSQLTSMVQYKVSWIFLWYLIIGIFHELIFWGYEEAAVFFVATSSCLYSIN